MIRRMRRRRRKRRIAFHVISLRDKMCI